MDAVDKSTAALDEVFRTLPKAELDKIIAEVSAMKFSGPTIKEYFENFEKEYIMTKTEEMKVIRYESPADETCRIDGHVVFLAGPTVRGNQQHLTSWRFACIEEFRKQGFTGTIVVPEFASKIESDKGKEWIPLWEYEGLKRADVIMFWIPRTRELIGLTTNWEHGYWVGKEPEKCVYGRPDDAYRMGYLDIMWKASAKNDRDVEASPIYKTLEDTVKATLELLKMQDSKRI
jgi:nucleoside 2-deoxyribosyltransferase